MKINKDYVAVKNNEVVLEDGLPKFAPQTLSTASMTYVNPNAEIYARFGFLPYDEGPSGSPDVGFHWVPDGYGVSDGRAYKKWKQVANPPPAIEDFDKAMEDHLVRERSERGYTTREPDSYLTSSVPRWKQDAEDWVAHRDAVMEYALELINAVQSGEREPPTMAEFIAGLPAIEWSYTDVSNLPADTSEDSEEEPPPPPPPVPEEPEESEEDGGEEEEEPEES